MYLSDMEYQNLLERVESLENCLPAVCKLDGLLHDRVLGCFDEEERAETVGEYGDLDGLLNSELFVEVARHHPDGDILLPDAHERISLAEYTTFLETWLKIGDDEDQLESLITLGAILMRKERGKISEYLKQVRDIRAKLYKRVDQLDEFV